jgi:hypothetical protein
MLIAGRTAAEAGYAEVSRTTYRSSAGVRHVMSGWPTAASRDVRFFPGPSSPNPPAPNTHQRALRETTARALPWLCRPATYRDYSTVASALGKATAGTRAEANTDQQARR